MLKAAAICFVILAGLDFFGLSFISDALAKTLESIALGLSLLIAVSGEIYKSFVPGRASIAKRNFGTEILLLILAVLISMYGAYVAHDQSFNVSFVAQRFMYFYALYFMLHALNVASKLVEGIITFVAILFVMVYIAVWINPFSGLTNVTIMDERSTIRVFLPGLLFVVLSLFLHLGRFLAEGKPPSIIVIVAGLFVIAITGSRMLLLSSFFFLLLFMIKNVRMQKSSIYLIATGAVCFAMYFAWPVIESLVEISLGGSSITDIANLPLRLESTVFFLFVFPPSAIHYIVGNGVASEIVEYGQEMLYLKEVFAFHQSDIGILGDYVRFGVLFLVGVGLLLVKSFRRMRFNTRHYLRYAMMFVVFSSITVSAFGSPDGIVALCCALYLVDCHEANMTNRAY